jgi:hypothetical protein
MAEGKVFRFMHEAAIGFAPTYKFDKGDPAPLAYDSSEKQRVPAWCDRILFRGSELTRSSAQVTLLAAPSLGDTFSTADGNAACACNEDPQMEHA